MEKIIASGVNKSFIDNATRKLGVSVLSIVFIFTPMATANAQDTNTQATAQTGALQGKHVILRAGPGFSPSAGLTT